MARQICATCVGAAFGLLLLDLPTVASAQTLGSSTIRGFVSLNAGGAHPAVPSFSDVAVDVHGINRDDVRADYRIKNGKSLDVGGGVIFGRGFLVGLAVSNSANKQPADLTLTLAHPQFHPTLTATTQTGALNHTETGVHIELGYALPQIKRVDVLVFAGPTHFSVSQPLVVDFVADETFDRTRRTYSAVVSDPITERKTGGAWGYHVGTDVLRDVSFARRIFNQRDMAWIDRDFLASRHFELRSAAERDHELAPRTHVPVAGRTGRSSAELGTGRLDHLGYAAARQLHRDPFRVARAVRAGIDA